MIDPNYMQNIKQLRDGSLSLGCITCLYISLYDRFEAFEDRPLYDDCMTCLYTSLYDRFETLRDRQLCVGCT